MTPTISLAITRNFAILAICCLLTACEDHNWRDGFRGRSDHFVYRDINGDDRITRPEWERLYGTVVNDPILVWFDELDCEGDGIVAWPEYYRNLFRSRERCPKRSGPFPSGSRSVGSLSPNILGAVTFCETDSDFKRALVSHREEPLTKTQERNVEISCGALVTGKPPNIGYNMGRCSPREGGPAPWKQALYSRISIKNNNADTTISVVTLSVALTSPEFADASQLDHLKTVTIPPKSEQVVTAWFLNNIGVPDINTQAELARCELHSAMGY